DRKTVPTSPIYLKGADLVLVLEPSRRPPKKNDPPRPPSTPGQSRPAPPKKEEEPERLLLDVENESPKTQQAVIEVEGGSLDIIGGEIRCPDYPRALLPPYLIRVKGGKSGAGVRLHDCRLTGPVFFVPADFKALLGIEGVGASSGPESDSATPQCG